MGSGAVGCGAGARTGHHCHPLTPPMAAKRPPLLLRDMRNPAAPMQPMTLKLPGQMIQALDRHAVAYNTSRMVLARTLLAQGLEQLEDH